MLLVTLFVLAFAILVWYIKSFHNYFKKRNVPHKQPVFFFGNLLSFLGRANFQEEIIKVHNAFKQYKYCGFYQFLTPAVIINDPELVGKLLVQDFSHFTDNSIQADEDVDYLSANNIFLMKGHKWKTIKALLTPMFTSVKFRSVYPLMEEVAERFTKFISNEVEAGRTDCVEGKPLCVRFTTENVANSVYGLQSNAFISPGETESEFVKVARDFGDPSIWNMMKLTLVFMLPSLKSFLKIKFLSKYTEDYLTGVIKETIKYRKENNIVRNDFLDMMYSLKEKSTEYVFDDRSVVAQAAGFFLDGVETSASTLSYVLYELAANPEVQIKLRDHIISTKAKNNGRIPYEQLNEMDYLDCVVNETLRKNAPGLVMFKSCTEDYELPPVGAGLNTKLKLKKGDLVLIPTEGLHLDPRYFPDPKKFIPERFTNENKSKIVKHTFLPFGEGPRACLGMRFGVTQMKVAVIALISSFSIELHEKMEYPLGINNATLVRSPVNGFWFRIKKLD